MKSILLILCVISAAFAHTTPLTDFAKGDELKHILNCKEMDKDYHCTLCNDGYDLKSNICEIKNQNISLNSLKEECRKSACGEASRFKTEAQVINYIYRQYLNSQYESTTVTVTQTVQFTNVFGNDYYPIPFFVPQTLSGGSSPIIQPFQSWTTTSSSSSSGPVYTAQTVSKESYSSKSQPLQSFGSSSSSPASASSSSNSVSDFSKTNNQVQGVDEADIMKTDGNYIYSISDQILTIILAYPAHKAKIISKMDLKEFKPSALFVKGNYLAVFGVTQKVITSEELQNDPFVKKYSPKFYYSGTYHTNIRIYDVEKKESPALLREYKISGKYYNGRMLDNGFIYLIIQQDLYSIPDPYPWYDVGLGKKNVELQSIFYYPKMRNEQPQAIMIAAFNLAKPQQDNFKVKVILSSRFRQVYMSQNHIYLNFERYQGQQLAYQSYIKKIYIDQSDIWPIADGKVPGRILNQFSMDQFGSFFRIATTSTKNWQDTNNLFVLDYFLKEHGKITQIAPGQTIRSVRFAQKRCYLVTFRQTDPFFVISLKDHKNPTILGELKITGFSSYLHLYDEETVIGLGREADLFGRTKGLKITLFNVSDVKNPNASANFEVSETYASSIAEYEHKAFLLPQNKNLMVIPGSMNSQGNSTVKFNGAFVFYISSSQIKLRGIVDHIINDQDEFSLRNVERSIYINQILYTKSKCLLKLNQIDNKTFKGVKNVDLPCNTNVQPPVSRT